MSTPSRPATTPSVWDAREARDAAERAALVRAVEALLPRAVESLVAAQCSEAWLTGSFAWGEPRATSDIDLIVVGLSPDRRSPLLDTLERLFQRPVDLAELERIPAARRPLALTGARRILP